MMLGYCKMPNGQPPIFMIIKSLDVKFSCCEINGLPADR